MKVKIRDLILIVDVLLDSMRKYPQFEIELGHKDFYWDIASNDLYNIDNKPKKFFLQQLTDDWSELLRLKKRKEIPITYDLKRLAAILRAIEESNSIALC